MSELRKRMTVKDPSFIPCAETLDYEKILELSDEEFEQLHSEIMHAYMDADGWWNNGKIPLCGGCHDPIKVPEGMVRYYGNSLHKNCFLDYHRKDFEKHGNTPEMKKYWDRVIDMLERQLPVRNASVSN
jgi:hypothetical protein